MNVEIKYKDWRESDPLKTFSITGLNSIIKSYYMLADYKNKNKYLKMFISCNITSNVSLAFVVYDKDLESLSYYLKKFNEKLKVFNEKYVITPVGLYNKSNEYYYNYFIKHITIYKSKNWYIKLDTADESGFIISDLFRIKIKD